MKRLFASKKMGSTICSLPLGDTSKVKSRNSGHQKSGKPHISEHFSKVVLTKFLKTNVDLKAKFQDLSHNQILSSNQKPPREHLRFSGCADLRTWA